MSTASFIQAMPKVEPSVQLEGAIQHNTLMMIAEQNEINETLKHFDQWVNLIREPDYTRTYEIARMACSWLKHADNLTRVVYDLGLPGIYFRSRYGHNLENWALFEPCRIRGTRSDRVTRQHPALAEAMQILGLRFARTLAKEPG